MDRDSMPVARLLDPVPAALQTRAQLGKFRNATVETAHVEGSVLKALNGFRSNLRTCVQNGHGLYLYGEPGSGKTYCGAALLNHALAWRYSVLMIGAEQLRDVSMSRHTKSFDEYETWWDRCRGVHVLLLDGLGSEYRSGNSSYTEDTFLALLRERHNAPHSVTLFTSHMPMTGSGETVKNVYGAEMANLISEMAHCVEVKSLGYRESIKDRMESLFT